MTKSESAHNKSPFVFRRKGLMFFSFCLLLTFCESNLTENSPPYTETERIIRAKYDSMSNFTWAEYIELLTVLSDKKFIVKPLNEMRRTIDKSSVVIGLRHDIDHNPFKALEMAKMEHQAGLRASYYILATSEYYGRITEYEIIRNPGMGELYREIYNTGAEIGIHNDLIGAMIQYHRNPYDFNMEELRYYKSLGIPIYGTAAHGGSINKSTVPNFKIFSDFAKPDSIEYEGKKYPVGRHSLREYRFKYEAYHIEYNKYFSESGGKWNDKDGFKGVLEKIKTSSPGDRIVILTHPEWWGKRQDF